MNTTSTDKIVLTIELNPALNSNGAYGIAKQSIESMLKINNLEAEIVYLGGKKEFLIRYLANLITVFQFEITDDTSKFLNDEDFID